MPSFKYAIETDKGLAEAAVAYEELPRSWFDRLIGRVAVAFGVGLCSPRDRDVAYDPTKGVRIAEGRLRARLDRGRQSPYSGVAYLSVHDWVPVRLADRVHRLAPASWWKSKPAAWFQETE